MTANRVDLVDISHWQGGQIGWARAKDAGVKGVYHKCTEGATYRDPNYAKRRIEAEKAGMTFGAYHFARPEGTDAVAEATYFIKIAGVKPGDLVPALDLETNDGKLSRAKLTAWVGQWVAVVEKATGVKPIIYTPFDLDDAFGCELWVARYNNRNEPPRIPAPWESYYMWQFSNGVYGDPKEVAGFGNVDLNVLGSKAPGILKVPFAPEPSKPKPQPAVKPKPGTKWEADVTTANIQNFAPNLTPAKVEADMRKVKPLSDLVLWQEIAEDRDFAAIIKVMGNTVWGNTYHGSECVISWKRALGKILKSETIKVANAAPGKYSPPRKVNRLLLETDIGEVEVICVHFTNGAYVGEKRKDRIPFWANCWDGTDRLVDAALRSGRPVIVGGDWNRATRDIPKFHKSQVWISGNDKRIDGVAVILPEGFALEVKGSTVNTPLNSDHDARTRRMAITVVEPRDPAVQKAVDQMAAARTTLKGIAGAKAKASLEKLQEAINALIG